MKSKENLFLNKKLNVLTVNELKSIIKKSGYKGYSKLIKKDLIKHIIKYKLYKKVNKNSPTRDGSESKEEYKEDNTEEESLLINPYYLTKYENIHKFLKTYNTEYLRILNGEELNTLKNSHFINPIRKKLIENMNGRKDYIVENIEGPISFSFYKIKHNGIIKKFYIYGENHIDTTGHCESKNNIDFSEYMKLVSQQTDKFIDFYYETGKPNFDDFYDSRHQYHEYYNYLILSVNNFLNLVDLNKHLINNNILEQIHNSFYNRLKKTGNQNSELNITSKIIKKLFSEFTICTKPETRNIPKCSLMRSHYIDIRHLMKPHYNDSMLKYISIYNYILHMNYKNKIKLLKYFGADTFFKTIGKFNLQIDQNTYPQIILDFYLEKIPKLSEKLDKSYYKQEIYDFSKKKIFKILLQIIAFGPFTTLKDFFKNTYKLIKNNNLNDINKKNYIDSYLRQFFIQLGAILVDMYCLSRIFKNFKSNGKSPSEPNTIIIYTGNSHSETYRNFLNFICTNINLLSTFKIPNEPTSCINMPYKYHI